MKIKTRGRNRLIALLSFVIAVPLLVPPALAQHSDNDKPQTKTVEEVNQDANPLPWLYKGSDVPVDKSWTFGELKNGLRYAVKKDIDDFVTGRNDQITTMGLC